jgi:hypothetical protein
MSEGLGERFYLAAIWSDALEESAVQSACVDCGWSIVFNAAVAQTKRGMCQSCWTDREQATRTAAQKGFRLGL